jgi:nitronate monooxygenase
MSTSSRPVAHATPAWPNRQLIDLLKIEHPIILAPMAAFGSIELAAGVSKAGGLASIGAARAPLLAGEKIQQLRKRTTHPININFFCHTSPQIDAARQQRWRDRLTPYYRELGLDAPSGDAQAVAPPFDAAACAVVEATRPEVVSFHLGLPHPSLVERVKAVGCIVMASATTVDEALWLEQHGADVIIAQGYEAGGHRGIFLASDLNEEVTLQPGTMALVPQVVDAVRLPVVAAGGIADARGIAAAFALGAAGVQLGTAYLLCPEALTPPLHREAIRHASTNPTVITKVFSGRPARAIANRLTRETASAARDVPDFPLAPSALIPLQSESERRGSSEFSGHLCGQAAALAKEMPAEALTRELAMRTLAHFRHLASANRYTSA